MSSDLATRLQAALGDAYRIERELGGGGMSRLFVAEEASLHRRVVVKVLPPQFASEVSAARFRQEVEVAARLQHPNILPVLAAGTRDDLIYYIIPYVPGESLRHRLTREGRLPVPDALEILREVADALAYAHSEGILHRDIKPENVLLMGRHASLTDFGVARALSEARTGEPLTETGLAVGTPGYMAPEQAAGERHLDARADVYALAVVGYEMLTGKPPFEGPTAQAVLAAHLTITPRPLSEIRPEVPAGVSEVIARALHKSPVDRLRTAAELRDGLRVEMAVSAPPSAGPLVGCRCDRPGTDRRRVGSVRPFQEPQPGGRKPPRGGALRCGLAFGRGIPGGVADHPLPQPRRCRPDPYRVAHDRGAPVGRRIRSRVGARPWGAAPERGWWCSARWSPPAPTRFGSAPPSTTCGGSDRPQRWRCGTTGSGSTASPIRWPCGCFARWVAPARLARSGSPRWDRPPCLPSSCFSRRSSSTAGGSGIPPSSTPSGR